MQPRIAEVAGIYLNSETGAIEGEFEQLINPEIAMPPDAGKVNHITDEMLRDAPTFAQYAPRLYVNLSRADVIVAHNLPFDKAMVKNEATRTATPEVLAAWPKKDFCTIDLYRQAWGKDMRLTALYELVIGQKLMQEHRGLSDVRALVEIIQADKLWEIMR
jgi:DNA polymerase III epsilon subunit-like protein